jgi:hypothetical protein
MTYSLTSNNFTGEILFTYNDAGLLTAMEVNADLDEKQHIGFLKMLPCNYNALVDWQRKHSHLSITEVLDNVTHDMFWDKYDDKIRSSKKKSLARWNKHSKADQIKAYNFISTYNRNRGTAEKKYAETYLNAELWNN